MKICGAALAALAGTSRMTAVLAGARHSFSPVALVDTDGNLIDCDHLPRARAFVFHYPHESTPYFLIKLNGPKSRVLVQPIEHYTQHRIRC